LGEGSSAVVACPDCGRQFSGRFCPDCGQRIEDLRRPFVALVRDFLADAFAFDARIWRTLGPLVLDPGRLTREYLAGRRARYVPPLKMYVFAGAVFFALMTATGGGAFRLVVSGETAAGAPFRIIVVEDEDGAGEVQREDARSRPDGWLARALDEATRDPAALNAAVIRTLSYAHFLLLPLFGLLLKAFWWRRYYVEHLVFSLHFHAFALIPGIALLAAWPLVVADEAGALATALRGAWAAIVSGWLFVALLRVYRGRWWTTAIRMVALGFVYLVVTGIVVTGMAIVTTFAF